MMRGIIVVICAILSVIFLKQRLHRHHWTGVAFIIAGVAEVGWVAIYIDGENSGSTEPAVGIALLLLSQCFTGAMFIVEETLLSKYYLDPFKIVGTEGMWGVLYYLFALPIMQSIKCTGDSGLNKLCNFGYLENSSYAFK